MYVMKKNLIRCVLMLGLIVFALTVCVKKDTSLAVTALDTQNLLKNPSRSVDTLPLAKPDFVSSNKPKSRAPEPTSLVLFLGGLGGMIVRFARRSFNRFKRCLDVFISVAGLCVSLPIVFCAAVLIKITSRGPVIYRQARVGKGGRIFSIYKLRTMRADAEKGVGAVWAKKNDPRITLVGRMLRKTRVDELPQLVNVIKGDMSIVGPRPERPELVAKLQTQISDYDKRLKVKPGITGLAQIYNRYDETIADVRKKIKYDLLYIKRMCWLVEMRIMAQTFLVVFT